MKAPFSVVPRTSPSTQGLAYLKPAVPDLNPLFTGMNQLSRGLLLAADEVDERKTNVEDMEANSAYTNYKLAQIEEQEALKRGPDGMRPDFAKLAVDAARKSDEQFFSTIPERLRPKFRARVDESRAALALDALDFQYKQQDAQYDAHIKDTVAKGRVTIFDNPTQENYDRTLAGALEQIEASDLAPLDKQKHVDNTTAEYGSVYYAARKAQGYRDAASGGNFVEPAGGYGNVIERQAQVARIRKQPIASSTRSFLHAAGNAAGATVVVTSGGQPATGVEGVERTGSHRHDLGGAADVHFEDADGRILKFTDPADQARIAAGVTAAVAAGATGLGAGVEYMGESTLHIGGGTARAWNAKGKAPLPWLTAAIERGKTMRASGEIPGAAQGDEFEQGAAITAGFEEFRSEPYFDTDKLRIGYGSDSATRAGGTHEAVTADTRVTKAEAAADLQYRMREVEGKIARDQLGTQWEQLPTHVKGVLYSVAINYGSLPPSVVAAVQTGNTELIAQSIENLETNRTRRQAEAAIVRGDGTSSLMFDPLESDPRVASVSLEDRLAARADAQSRVAAEMLAEEKARSDAQKAQFNELLKQETFGEPSQARINDAFAAGKVPDYDDMVKLQKAHDDRMEALQGAQEFPDKRDTKTYVEGRPEDVKSFNDYVGTAGITKITNLDDAYMETFRDDAVKVGDIAPIVVSKLETQTASLDTITMDWAFDQLAQLKDLLPEAAERRFGQVLMDRLTHQRLAAGVGMKDEDMLDYLRGGESASERQAAPALDKESTDRLMKTSSSGETMRSKWTREALANQAGFVNRGLARGGPAEDVAPDILVAMEQDWGELFKQGFRKHKNEAKAKAFADDRFPAIWRDSKFANPGSATGVWSARSNFMKYPPELVYPGPPGPYFQELNDYFEVIEGEWIELIGDEQTHSEWERRKARVAVGKPGGQLPSYQVVRHTPGGNRVPISRRWAAHSPEENEARAQREAATVAARNVARAGTAGGPRVVPPVVAEVPADVEGAPAGEVEAGMVTDPLTGIVSPTGAGELTAGAGAAPEAPTLGVPVPVEAAVGEIGNVWERYKAAVNDVLGKGRRGPVGGVPRMPDELTPKQKEKVAARAGMTVEELNLVVPPEGEEAVRAHAEVGLPVEDTEWTAPKAAERGFFGRLLGFERGGSYPSPEEAEEALRTGQLYGRDVEKFTQKDVAKVVSTMTSQEVSDLYETGEMDESLPEGAPSAPLRKLLAQAAVAAQKSPVASLGFDPRAIVTHMGKQKFNLSGFYIPGTDTMWVDPKFETTFIHEALHRGFEKIKKEVPGAENLKGSQEEKLVRLMMMKYYGQDVEMGQGPEGDKQIATARATSGRYASIIEKIEAAAAKKIGKRGGPR